MLQCVYEGERVYTPLSPQAHDWVLIHRELCAHTPLSGRLQAAEGCAPTHNDTRPIPEQGGGLQTLPLRPAASSTLGHTGEFQSWEQKSIPATLHPAF